MAAAEKQPNASAVPPKALTKMLQVENEDFISCISLCYPNLANVARQIKQNNPMHITTPSRDKQKND
jgi:hypothetical protein